MKLTQKYDQQADLIRAQWKETTSDKVIRLLTWLKQKLFRHGAKSLGRRCINLLNGNRTFGSQLSTKQAEPQEFSRHSHFQKQGVGLKMPTARSTGASAMFKKDTRIPTQPGSMKSKPAGFDREYIDALCDIEGYG